MAQHPSLAIDIQWKLLTGTITVYQTEFLRSLTQFLRDKLQETRKTAFRPGTRTWFLIKC